MKGWLLGKTHIKERLTIDAGSTDRSLENGACALTLVDVFPINIRASPYFLNNNRDFSI